MRPRKNRPIGRERLLSVGEVARQLGLSEDVVRSLMDSGELKTVRTGGGHRRCPPEEVKRFKAGGRRPTPGRTGAPRPEASRPAVQSQRVFEDEELTLDEYEAEIKREAARERAKAEDQRLEGWKKYGRDYARRSILPSAWQVRVVEDLESFITTTRIPPTLQVWEAQLIVQARVNELVTEYREAESARQQKEAEAARERQRSDEERTRAEGERRQKERDAAELRSKQEREAAEQLRTRQEEERRLQALIDRGNTYAWKETIVGWDWSEAQRARREVERALKEEVRADWSEEEVDDLVDDVLHGEDDEELEEEEEEDESW